MIISHESPGFNSDCSGFVGFNEFISERERTNPKSKDSRMALFDEIVLSKRNRGRSSLFSGRSTTDFLSDTSHHLWRTASASFFTPSSRSQSTLSGDYSRVAQRGEFISSRCRATFLFFLFFFFCEGSLTLF